MKKKAKRPKFPRKIEQLPPSCLTRTFEISKHRSLETSNKSLNSETVEESESRNFETSNKKSQLPTHWKTVKLGEVCEMNPPEFLPKGFMAKKIAMQNILPFSRKITGYIIAPYSGGTKFRNGDVLLARITPCLENGKSAQVTILEKNEIAFGSTEYIVFRGKKGLTNSDFIYYLVNSVLFRTIAIQSMVGTSGRKRVQENVLYDFSILLPPLEEQKWIVEKITAIDTLIDTARSLLDLKKRFFKATLEKLLTPPVDVVPSSANLHTRPLEISKKSPNSGTVEQSKSRNLAQTLETSKPRIKTPCQSLSPAPLWQSLKLGDVCEIKKGVQLSKCFLTETGAYPALNGGISPSGYTDSWNVESETVTISEGGNSCGFINFNLNRFWCGGHCYALLNPKIEPKLLYFILKKHESEIMKLRVGSGLPNIQKTTVAEYTISIPNSKSVQNRLLSILSQLETEIGQLERMIGRYETLKNIVMNNILTGTWRQK